jgi:hypothetical protein
MGGAVLAIALLVAVILVMVSEPRLAVDAAAHTDAAEHIPRRVMQTYHDAKRVPAKVYNNIAKYAPGFEHRVLDDDDAIRFLSSHFDGDVVRGFEGLLLGAHKADLLRYCLLYVYGGVYLDIKTELLMPLSEVICDRRGVDLYVVLQHDGLGIYNGVLAATPRNSLFLELVRGILRVPRGEQIPYQAFLKHFLEVLRVGLMEPLVCGVPLRSVWGGVFVLREGCTQSAQDCHDGLDRYGLCCYIHDAGRRVIKVRYSDYPFK